MTTTTAGFFSAGNASRVLALATGFALLLVVTTQSERLAPAPAEPLVEVAVGEWRFRAEPEVVGTLERVSRRHVVETGLNGQARLEALIAAELDRVFSDLSERLPVYADWHYSLRGEYARLAVLMFGRSGLVDDNAIRRKAFELIFEDAGFDQAIGRLDQRSGEVLSSHVRMQQTAWLAEIMEALDREGGLAQNRPVWSASLSFDPLLSGFEELQGEGLQARLLTSTGIAGAGALAAPMAARVIGRRAAVALRPAAGRVAARGGMRSATAGGGGLLGCAATGPAALPCMVVVGGAVWLATDLLMLGADEWFNREELIADMQHGLEEMRAELELALSARYAAAIDAWTESMDADLSRTFSPIHAISAHPGLERSGIRD